MFVFEVSLQSLTLVFLACIPRSFRQITRIVFGFLLPFATVSLCGVAGLAQTFPSFPVSGPFLPDVPGFQVPPDNIFPPQLQYSSRVLPLHLHFDNCSDVFSFLPPLDVPEPLQPSPSHNHRYLFHLFFFDLSVHKYQGSKLGKNARSQLAPRYFFLGANIDN